MVMRTYKMTQPTQQVFVLMLTLKTSVQFELCGLLLACKQSVLKFHSNI